MNNIFFSTDIGRANYERIVQAIADSMSANLKRTVTTDEIKRAYKIMPSVLKMAQALDPGKSQYIFSPRKGVDPLVPNAILLDQNDFYAIAGLGVRLGRADYAAGVYSNHGNYPLLTYPDPVYFSNTGTAVGAEATSLQTLVNGSIGIQVNGDYVVDPTNAQEFFLNPQSRAVSSPLAYPQFGPGDDGRGIFPVTPQIILDASADNGIVFNLANGVKSNIDGNIATGTTAATTRNFLYFIAYGWKVKNLAGAGATCDRA